MRLYRYISFEEFINLFVNKKERFVRPTSWDDKFEGYSYSLMETVADVRRMVELMYYDLCPRNHFAIAGNMTKLWHAKWFAYAQCWTRAGNSDSMWRSYGYDNKSIRIRTTDKKILGHLDNCLDSSRYTTHFAKVKYDVNEKNDILRKQIEQLKDSNNVYEPFFHKRRAFLHEKECRIVIVDNINYFADYLSGQGIKFTVDKEIAKLVSDEEKIDVICKKIMEFRSPWNEMSQDIEDSIFLENICVKDYIEGVMIHPLAPKWYSEIVGEICNGMKIRYEGISDIYERS